MDSGRLIFDASCHGNMLLMGSEDPLFRGHRSLFNMEETSKKRPFFSSSDDYMEEEIYDEQFMPEKKRRLTPDQVHMLEKSFEAENKLEPERKSELAKKLGLQPRQVAVWFQNRRARWKTKQLERDYDLLKSSYDSLLSDYHMLLKDNDKLKSQKVSLTEKMDPKDVVVGIGDYEASPAAAAKDVVGLEGNVKAEDLHSSVSSVVVDEEGPGHQQQQQQQQQLVDSGDSYFLEEEDEDYRRCMMGGVQSEEEEEEEVEQEGEGEEEEEEEGSDKVFVQQGQAEEQLGWWVWS